MPHQLCGETSDKSQQIYQGWSLVVINDTQSVLVAQLSRRFMFPAGDAMRGLSLGYAGQRKICVGIPAVKMAKTESYRQGTLCKRAKVLKL